MGKISASIDMTEGKSASAVATNYVTEVSNSGITVHPSSTTANRVLINADGMEVFRSNDSVALYGDTVRIGKKEEAYIEIDSSKLSAYNTNLKKYFEFGDTGGVTQAKEYTYDGVPHTEGLPLNSTQISVYRNDSLLTAGTDYSVVVISPLYGEDSLGVEILIQLTIGDVIRITYVPTDEQPYFTFITRQAGSGIGSGSVSLGADCSANGQNALAEGFESSAIGDFSHAEGSKTRAVETCAHAEGSETEATEICTHAEGSGTKADAPYAHAEGSGTIANGNCAHAEGSETIAFGRYSHASGLGNVAYSECETAIGKYNAQVSDAKLTIGNGTADSARSNCFSIFGNNGEIHSARQGNILWTGAYYMTASHTATFTNSQKVSEQLNGIVLVWSAYSNSTAQNYDWTYYFVPKWHVAFREGQSVDILMMNNTIASNVMCRKLVYVYDDRITGNDNNTATGTGYANNAKVLRAVIGV